MKNLYEILEVDNNASLEEIKKSYKKLSIIHHPDKGGDINEMKQINDAHDILSDAGKRKEYDLRLSYIQEPELESRSKVILDNSRLIESGELKKCSQEFREQHSELVKVFRKTPLENRVNDNSFGKFESNIYKVESISGDDIFFHDIFSLYGAGEDTRITQLDIPEEKLSPEVVIDLFLNYLSGKYINKIILLEQYLSKEIYKLEKAGVDEGALKLAL
tara:strand:+ start:2111 stop:2764 length:654 start_codon:yes stop_codon:yes gene_type:complete